MKKVIGAALTACVLAVPAFAQDALEAARAANVCDATAAEFLADGRLKVTCRPGTVNPAYSGQVAQPAVLAGTGLGTAGAVAAGVIVLALLVGDDDDESSTTTSTTTN